MIRESIQIAMFEGHPKFQLIALEAIYLKPRTSQPHPEHKIYPYLLRNPSTERSNQAWTADIT